MAATVCIGCGLTTDINGKLIVNTGGAEWPYACDETNGSPLYCGGDGVVRAAPPVLGKLISLEGAQTWASTAQPVTNDTTTYFSLPFTAENPSDCLSALVEYAVEFEISVNMDDDARFRGFFNGNRYQDFTQRGGSASNIGWQLTSTQAFILGPGASSAQTVNIGVDKIGSADVYLQRIEVRIRGLITAMEM